MSITTDWDQYAACYDALCHLTPYQELLATVASSSCSYPDLSLLDASCGTANFILARAAYAKTTRYIGIDSSSAMLKRARQKCASDPNCSFHEINLNLPLPFSNEEFDQVVSINTLYAVARPEVTLQEFLRVLRPGGVLLLANPTESIENGFILKAHAKDAGPDEYWANLHATAEREETLIKQAVTDPLVASQLIQAGRHNRHIANDSNFHTLSKECLVHLLSTAGFTISSLTLTYANQAYFCIATKEHA